MKHAKIETVVVRRLRKSCLQCFFIDCESFDKIAVFLGILSANAFVSSYSMLMNIKQLDIYD